MRTGIPSFGNTAPACFRFSMPVRGTHSRVRLALRFTLADATDFDLGSAFDAVFSSSTGSQTPGSRPLRLRHPEAGKPLRGSVWERNGYKALNPWYFPSIGEYSTLL